MLNNLIRIGGALIGAPLKVCGAVVGCITPLAPTGWANQLTNFGDEMERACDNIASANEERELLVGQLTVLVSQAQQQDPVATQQLAEALAVMQTSNVSRNTVAAEQEPAT